MPILVWSLSFLMQGCVDDAPLLFSASELFHVAVRTGKFNLVGIADPSPH